MPLLSLDGIRSDISPHNCSRLIYHSVDSRCGSRICRVGCLGSPCLVVVVGAFGFWNMVAFACCLVVGRSWGAVGSGEWFVSLPILFGSSCEVGCMRCGVLFS